jgi:hypothetical protein
MPWLGIPASVAAAYVAAKYEDTRIWTGFSVVLWTLVSVVILGALALLLALPIAAAKVLLTP